MTWWDRFCLFRFVLHSRRYICIRHLFTNIILPNSNSNTTQMAEKQSFGYSKSTKKRKNKQLATQEVDNILKAAEAKSRRTDVPGDTRLRNQTLLNSSSSTSLTRLSFTVNQINQSQVCSTVFLDIGIFFKNCILPTIHFSE